MKIVFLVRVEIDKIEKKYHLTVFDQISIMDLKKEDRVKILFH